MPTTDSEVHAYKFILDELIKKKGWKKAQVLTQQECHRIKAIKDAIGGKKPENVVMISDKTCYVIEAKNERKKLNTAVKEAKEEYADRINEQQKLQAIFITGIAGNDEEGFICKSEYYKNGKWEAIEENGVEITGLLSSGQVDHILRTKSGKIEDIEITEKEFHVAAKEINGILHENAINKDYRARFISALLLALTEGSSEIDLNEMDTSVLIVAINKKVESILNRHKKHEFARFIKIDEPSNQDNHVKVRAAIVNTIEKLLSLNIRSAMKSGRDVLGEFYEAFLKYGNGAKEIGVVLTPRHITRFAAEVLDVQTNDIVLDPACGTGGFLVAALDVARKKSKSDKDFDGFKEEGIYGIEEQDPIIALAIVNMIFRGDGKNNMIEGNCFNKWLTVDDTKKRFAACYVKSDFDGRLLPITKVLMNPPFSQKSSKSKEYQFIEHAIAQMQDEGLLFAVLPISVLIERAALEWRKEFLKRNTLISVVTFPTDLFYPTGTNTLGMFVRKGVPHNPGEPVLWMRALHDGFVKKKGKRVRNKKEKDDITTIQPLLFDFVKDSRTKVKNIPQFQKKAPINFSDENLELVPEAYLDDKELTQEEIEKSMELLMRETACYLIRTKS
ncbi:SAM-dependent methyltransferase [Patescibacteria group bacterium]|nr:SAM-dependent methyltransferase [Patescibacteria group bacterium]MBU1124300.1 SAM-dependent methyltransferase [Patescibacteria group bacterium]MBU1988776.1 SAM-dependent methyltransferase [Nanoarchaeota archaeon]